MNKSQFSLSLFKRTIEPIPVIHTEGQHRSGLHHDNNWRTCKYKIASSKMGISYYDAELLWVSPTKQGYYPLCSSINSPWGAVDPGSPGYCWNTQCMIVQTRGLLGSGEQLWLHFHRSRMTAHLGTWLCNSLQIWSTASLWCRCKFFHHHAPYLHMCSRMLCSRLHT